MATNDGYTPYSVDLTASQVKTALQNAHNYLPSALPNGYTDYIASGTKPTQTADSRTIRAGMIWNDTTNQRVYRAIVTDTETVWIEL